MPLGNELSKQKPQDSANYYGGGVDYRSKSVHIFSSLFKNSFLTQRLLYHSLQKKSRKALLEKTEHRSAEQGVKVKKQKLAYLR